MKSKEEILARKLDDLLADSRLEHYLIGRYFAQTATTQNYDNFEVMVESARQEKENRIEWLKDIIIGEKMNKTPLMKQCEILDDLWVFHEDNELLADLYSTFDISFPLAHSYRNEYVTGLTEEGLSQIQSAWTEVLRILGLSDGVFESADEMIEAFDLSK